MKKIIIIICSVVMAGMIFCALTVHFIFSFPMCWSGHYSEFRTPRQYFKECWGVTVPPDASLLIDERELEFRLVWQCTPAEIAAIEKNPPAEYYYLPWKNFEKNSFLGKFSPADDEVAHILYLQGRRRSGFNSLRFLILDKAKSQLIGLSFSD